VQHFSRRRDESRRGTHECVRHIVCIWSYSIGILHTVPFIPGQSFKDIEYARADGHPLLLDAFVPAQSAPVPAAILVHGGGWVAGDRIRNVEPLFEPLAANGFAWFSISYTLTKNISGFGTGVQDVLAAISYVRTHAAAYNVDPERIFLIGESAGAQLAALAALSEPMPPVRAVVGFYIPADLEDLARSSRYLEGYAGALLTSPLASLLLPRLRELSPLRKVRAGAAPFLLIHGDRDNLVPFTQSEAMCKAVRNAGSACDLMAVRGGGHGLRWWESAQLTGYKKLMMQWLLRQ
jgi:acetyl esterase